MKEREKKVILVCEPPLSPSLSEFQAPSPSTYSSSQQRNLPTRDHHHC